MPTMHHYVSLLVYVYIYIYTSLSAADLSELVVSKRLLEQGRDMFAFEAGDTVRVLAFKTKDQIHDGDADDQDDLGQSGLTGYG